MLANAPFLTRPIATVIPSPSWHEMRYVQLGLMMYDMIAFKGGLPRRSRSPCRLTRSHTTTWKEMQYFFPKLNFDWVKGGLMQGAGEGADP